MFSAFIKACTRFYQNSCQSLFNCVICTYPVDTANNLCRKCYSSLPSLPHHCRICGRFLHHIEDVKCGKCLKKVPSYNSILAAYPYQWPIEQMIQKLKFQGQLKFAKTLSELMLEKVKQQYQNEPLPQALFPVPLHKNRLQKRGFNQVMEILKPIAKRLLIPVFPHAIERCKYTLPQSGLSAKQRKTNVSCAFTTAEKFTLSHVAVVDDVITTGETIEEICSLLRKVGINRIDAWCCARNG